jgi:hypothetical protein
MNIRRQPPDGLKFWEVKEEILTRMRAKLDLSKLTGIEPELLRHELYQVVDRVCDAVHPQFDPVTKDMLANEIVSEILRG